MTCREKLKLEHPAEECYDVEKSRCPSEFGYLDDPEWCIVSDRVCDRCWGREIPDDFSESKYLHSLGESLAEGLHSSVNHSEKSGENSLTMCFSKLIDAVSQGKVTVHYDVKSGIFKIIPAKIVRRDEELDKR